MTSNADNAFIKHDPNYTNACGQWMNSTEANNAYLGKPFVDYLKNNNDPRLKAIANRYVGAKSGPEQTAAKSVTDPSVQIGMPFGYDNNSIKTAVAADGLASFYDYSQCDRFRFGKNTAPMFLVTYSQTSLLLAEAIQRVGPQDRLQMHSKMVSKPIWKRLLLMTLALPSLPVL